MVDIEDEAESHDSSETLSQSSSSEMYMVGFVLVNIVGMQHYRGTIKGRELVGLVREPLNPYDSNAIKVLNTRSIQVGHMERDAAAALAPLIDANLISIEGIIPKTRGSDIRYKIPCQIHIFTRMESFERVKTALSNSRLHIIYHDNVGFNLSESMVVKEKCKGSGGKNVDDVFKLVDEEVSKKGAFQPLEPPKGIIKSELFLHQKEGLSWLVHREKGDELPPFWEERAGSFVNVLTNHETSKKPPPILGGIFADDMGLGKTLALLSLISFDKQDGVNVETSDEIMEDESMVVSGSKKLKRTRACQKVCASSNTKRETGDVISCNKSNGKLTVGAESKTTLIVCPPSVLSTWITQLKDHTKQGSLKVYLFYGEPRTRDASELQKYDIVLTTYSTLASDVKDFDSPIRKIEWWRVILDEAHIIKNSKSSQSEAVIGLNAKRRWIVTGTPIQNGSMDLYSLMAFLRFEPFSIYSYWDSLVQRPLAQGSEKGLSRLQVLMATISLRRTKEKTLVGLPPKIVETSLVDLCAEERALYEQMEKQARSFVRDYISSGSIIVKYTTILSIILRLRQVCTDRNLCPSGLKAFLPSSNIEDVSDRPELLQKLISVLQDGEDFDCPICMSTPIDIIITRCAHVFCRLCILKTLQKSRPCCPLCRHRLSNSDLFSSPSEPLEACNVVTSATTPSSKVVTLLKLLSASKDQNPETKSVIFSQFRKLLILLEEPLKSAGYKILRLDGTMSAKKRANVIEEFGVRGPDSPTILLASLRSTGTGINLTAASRVYFMEPWWNPAVEEQAMDRVHRIGQKDEVKVVRLIARNSIEERVLELQEKKKLLCRETFNRNCRKERREICIDDVRCLLSL